MDEVRAHLQLRNQVSYYPMSQQPSIQKSQILRGEEHIFPKYSENPKK